MAGGFFTTSATWEAWYPNTLSLEPHFWKGSFIHSLGLVLLGVCWPRQVTSCGDALPHLEDKCWAFHFLVSCGVPGVEEPLSMGVSLPGWMQPMLRHLKLRGCPEGRGVTSAQEPSHPPTQWVAVRQVCHMVTMTALDTHFLGSCFLKVITLPGELILSKKKSKGRWGFTVQFPALELTDCSFLSLARFRLFSGQSAPQDHEFLPLPLPSPGAELHRDPTRGFPQPR